MGKNVHIVPTNNGWGVKMEGDACYSAIYGTQDEAINYGRIKAIIEKSELLIHGADGKIRQKNSYGNDPFPPRG